MVQKRSEDEDYDEQSRETKRKERKQEIRDGHMHSHTHIVFIGSEIRFENASNVRNRIWNHVFGLEPLVFRHPLSS